MNEDVLTVDLTDSRIFDWRALVASMSVEDATRVVGPGLGLVNFRILHGPFPEIPPRDVLEFVQSSGITHHLHYQENGSANRPVEVEPSTFPY